MSHVAVSFDLPEYTANVDALGTLRILEAVRLLKLEKKVNPYILAEFMNDYGNHSKELSDEVKLDTYFESTYGDFDR